MANIICPNCSAELEETKKFCTECGTKLLNTELQNETTNEPDEIALQPTQKFEIPTEETNTLEQRVKDVFQKDDDLEEKPRWWSKKKKDPEEDDPIVDFSALAGCTLDGSPYEPISAWGYIGILALLLIPVIGWIFAIVWACGGCKKLNKRNLSRGYLLTLGMIGVFILCAYWAVFKIAPEYLERNPGRIAASQEAVYTVQGINNTPAPMEDLEDLEEGSDSLITYFEEVGDAIWVAFQDRSLSGGEEITAILAEDKDSLINMGYSETSVDQVFNLVNGDLEALTSLLNQINGQSETSNQ